MRRYQRGERRKFPEEERDGYFLLSSLRTKLIYMNINFACMYVYVCIRMHACTHARAYIFMSILATKV